MPLSNRPFCEGSIKFGGPGYKGRMESWLARKRKIVGFTVDILCFSGWGRNGPYREVYFHQGTSPHRGHTDFAREDRISGRQIPFHEPALAH